MTYLYTAWIWNQGMEGGSNIDQTMTDGTTRSLYNMDVINIGNSTPSWQVFTCRYKAPRTWPRPVSSPWPAGPAPPCTTTCE